MHATRPDITDAELASCVVIDVRLNHRLSKASDLSLHYSFGDRSFFDPFGAPGPSASVPVITRMTFPGAPKMRCSAKRTPLDTSS